MEIQIKKSGRYLPQDQEIVLVCKKGSYFLMPQGGSIEKYYGKYPETKIVTSATWTEALKKNNGQSLQMSHEMAARAERIVNEIIAPILKTKKAKSKKSHTASRHDARVFPLGKYQTSTR